MNTWLSLISSVRSAKQNVNIWNEPKSIRLLSAACNKDNLLLTLETSQTSHIDMYSSVTVLLVFSCLSHILLWHFFVCTLKVCKPRHRHRTNARISTTSVISQCVCLCRGELSPQIEEHMLQYVFYLDFYFLVFFFFLEMTLKKMTVFCLL